MSLEVRQRGCAPGDVELLQAGRYEPRQHVRVRQLGHAQSLIELPGVVLELEQTAEAAQSLGEGHAGRAGDVLARGQIRSIARHRREDGERSDHFQTLLGGGEPADDVRRGEQREHGAASLLVHERERRPAGAEARADLLSLEGDDVGCGSYGRAPDGFNRLVQHASARLARGVPVQNGRAHGPKHGLEPRPLVLDRLLRRRDVGPSSGRSKTGARGGAEQNVANG